MEFSQWIMTNGQKQINKARCNTCKDKHEAQEERMRQTNKAMVQPTLNPHTFTQDHPSCKPMVTIFCKNEKCGHGNEIDMNRFWHRTKDGHRSQNISCSSCKTQCRLGKWLRRHSASDNSIEEWLKENNAAKDKERPARITVDLYLTQDIPAEQSLKRCAPNDATAKPSKRQKK